MKKLLVTAALAVGLMTTSINAEESWWELGPSTEQCLILPRTLSYIMLMDADLDNRDFAHAQMSFMLEGLEWADHGRRLIDLLYDHPDYANLTLVKSYLSCMGFDEHERDIILGSLRPQS